MDHQIKKGIKYLSTISQEDHIAVTSSSVSMTVICGDENGSCNLQRRGVSCLCKVPRKLSVVQEVERGVMAD